MPPEGSEKVPINTDVDALQRARERLYAKDDTTAFNTPTLRARAQQEYAQKSWEPPPPPPPPRPKKPISWSFIFLGAAVVFFFVAAGISFLFLAQGGRSVSSDKITITVQGPTTTASGTAVPLVVTIQNHNPAAITDTDVTLDFPDGTRSATDVTQPTARYTDTLGSVPPGGIISRTASAVFFGTTNQTITVPITLNYHTAGSNALFTKKQNYTFTITSSPLTITVQAVPSVAAGQPFTIALSVRSNATQSLDNIAVVPQYPTGFTPQSVSVASPGAQSKAAAPGSPFLAIGTLAPGEEKHFTITGTLSGSENDQHNFQFTVGTAAADGSPTLSVAYASQALPIVLTKPFLAASLSLNHSDADPTVINAGDPIAGLVSWVNTLSGTITNAKVSVVFSGSALDASSISSQNGFYDSSHNTLLFSPQTEPGLATVNPNGTGSDAFSFSTKSATALQSLRNPTIQLTVTVSGQTDNGSQNITNTVTHTVQVATDLALTSRIVHTSGPFPNTGPIPPVPNQATTYTVLLSVTNGVNSVAGASATMILPSYVTFAAHVSPNDGSVTYDDTSRTVTWKVGDVPAGTVAKPVTAAFQISFTPSTSQKGTVPTLVGNQTLTGTDRFTNAQVGSVAQALTTETTTDPGYQPSFGTLAN